MKELQRLAQCLEKELSYQEAVLKVLTKERAAIVALNQDEIERSALEKEQLLKSLKRLEGERLDLMTAIAVACDVPVEQLSIKAIIDGCEVPSIKTQFSRIRDELKDVAETVQEMNTHNSALVRQSLETITSSLAIIHSAADSGGSETYGAAGEVSDKKKSASSGRLRTSV